MIKTAGAENRFLQAISRDENEATESDLKKRMVLSLVLLAAEITVGFAVKDPRSAYVVEAVILAMLIVVNIHCFVDAFLSVKTRKPEKNLLAAVGTIFAICVLHLLAAGVIMATMALCRYCEFYISLKLNCHLTDLIDTEPSDSGIYVGDMVQVPEGEIIPVDGMIMSGETTIDEEMVTGERIPARKSSGDLVYAGTRNISTEITVKATHTGGSRVISRIILHISRSITTKPPKSARYEKVARSFVIVVIAVAVTAAVLWTYATGNAADAIVTGISVLVIANPYAFSVAIPMTVLAAVVRGSEHGILIRSADILEDTRDINTIVLNKRGTITTGEPEVSDVVSLSDGFDLKMAGILEAKAMHPFGKMIHRQAREEYGEIPEAEILERVAGRGIVCSHEGKTYIVGNAAFMEDRGIVLKADGMDALFRQGKSLVFFADEKALIGIIALRDAPKPESLKAITQMENMGLDVVMLTGDSRQTAEAVRNEIGIDHIYADIKPGDKRSIVEKIRNKNNKIVAMVGDGDQDGEAIAASDLGIAIGTGKGISIGSADIVMITDDLHDLVRAMRLSRLCIRNLRQSVAFAYIYNLLAIICAGGLFAAFTGLALMPLASALCMGASQILVTLNALRIKRSRLL